jgi:hypothetical protein
MTHGKELSPFEQRARSLLHESVRTMDDAACARLAQARAAALSQGDAHSGWFRFRYLAPAGAVATVILVTAMFTSRLDAPGVNDPAGNALYDLELLADADDFELSQEPDLEFIEWAATMGEQGKAGT